MNTVLLIEKDGNLKITNIKDINKVYCVCNYRNDTNFELLYSWKNLNVTYDLYGKKKTKGAIKNIYQLPYPIDKETYYGTLCIIKKIDNEIVNISLDDWSSLINYNELKKTDKTNEPVILNKNNNSEKNKAQETEEDIVKTLLQTREKELTHEEYEDE